MQGQSSWLRAHLRSITWVVFAVGVLIWTWLLLTKSPMPDWVMKSWSEVVLFYLAKTSHFTGYFILTFLATLAAPRNKSGWVLGGMLLHAALSEVGQFYGAKWFGTGRTGSLRDVGLDLLGILLGLLAGRAVHRLFLAAPKMNRVTPPQQ